MKTGGKRIHWIGLALFLVLVGYIAARPALKRFGINLPAIVSSDSSPQSETTEPDSAQSGTSSGQQGSQKGAKTVGDATGRQQGSQAASGGSKTRLGALKDVGGGVQVSTAGLRYTPGSAEGHRLKHVLRHDNDQPDRPGYHGVFDGDRDDLLAVLDEAYLLAQKGGSQVRGEKQGSRTVYTVNLKRRIGFVGGRDGKRKNNPPARAVKLVLEGNKLITAYPVER